MFRIISLGPLEPVGPGVNDRFLIEVIHGGHETVLEFLFGGDTDAAEDGPGELWSQKLSMVFMPADMSVILRADGSSEFELALAWSISP